MSCEEVCPISSAIDSKSATPRRCETSDSGRVSVPRGLDQRLNASLRVDIAVRTRTTENHAASGRRKFIARHQSVVRGRLFGFAPAPIPKEWLIVGVCPLLRARLRSVGFPCAIQDDLVGGQPILQLG